jgi:uncharacterized protein (TIGR01777 family)
MKIVIPGGSGQVGTLLARSFHGRGDEVVVLSREPAAAPWTVLRWNAADLGTWVQAFEGADAIVNLAGRSVNCRYNEGNRAEILRSRVVSTRIVGEAISRARRAPRVWLQASTATIYAHRHDAPNDESDGLIGGGEPGAPAAWRFSTDVAKAWEREVDRVALPRTRTLKLRSAMTMSADAGGVFDMLLRLVRFGLGGRAGDGRQFVSWIHEMDFLRAIDWLLDSDLEGAVNLAAPQPLPNEEFMRALRKAWGAPVGLPAAEWMLESGARLLGTETELVLKSRRVVPATLLNRGFEFRYPSWPDAARDLCRRWRAERARR